MTDNLCIKSVIRLYIPFNTHKTLSFRKKLNKDKSWNNSPVIDTSFYLRYIDRIFNKESICSDCYATEKALDSLDFDYNGYPFSISKARIFSFDTNVAFLELNVNIENCDFETLESINHLLRQSDENTLYTTDKTFISINAIANNILSPYGQVTLFDHIGSGASTRPELFVTVITDSSNNSDTHTYKLANGLDNNYNGEFTDCEFYSNFSHIKWAVTKRGICNMGILTDNDKNNKFIMEKWILYTDTRYIIWYILALHQKYALFRCLNEIADKTSSRYLGEFQKQIMILNTKYRFSLISEETSYQKVYEIMCRTKNLNYEFEDADEEVERIFEYNEAKSNKNTTIAMTMISILCAFSAVKDLIELMTSKDFSSIASLFSQLTSESRLIASLFILIIMLSLLILIPRHKISGLFHKIKKKLLKILS